MTKNDYPQFVALWTMSFEMYDKRPSDGAIDLAFASLERYEIEDIRRALTAHFNDADNGRFTPKPADIVRHIDGDPQSRSLSAWTKVINAISSCGSWRTVVFDDPIIHCVIDDMGGWIELCGISDQEEPFKRNEFAKRYSGYLSRPPESYPSRLIGMAEAHNAGRFDAFLEPPALVGDHRKALDVMNSGGERKQMIRSLADVAKMLPENVKNG